MVNPYRRAMFFLTYIKGARVNEWVMVVNRWLARQIQGGVATNDERLWNEVATSFTRQFADNLAKENAQAILRAGVKMKGEDIDTYIVEIEELIRLSGYRFDVPQTIETFTDGLPTGLYQKILELDRPATYDQWKQVAINRQQDYIHMKAQLKAHRGGGISSRPRGWMPPQRMLADPNVMDTSAGRTRGRIAGSKEMNPATMPRGGYVPRGGYMQRGRGGGKTRDLREVECYTCHKKGHLSRNCSQHTWNQPNNQQNWTPRPSQGHDAIVDDRSICGEETIVARSSTQTPQQQADTWLRGMATAGEDVQELVLQDLVGREGFQDA